MGQKEVENETDEEGKIGKEVENDEEDMVVYKVLSKIMW